MSCSSPPLPALRRPLPFFISFVLAVADELASVKAACLRGRRRVERSPRRGCHRTWLGLLLLPCFMPPYTPSSVQSPCGSPSPSFLPHAACTLRTPCRSGDPLGSCREAAPATHIYPSARSSRLLISPPSAPAIGLVARDEMNGPSELFAAQTARPRPRPQPPPPARSRSRSRPSRVKCRTRSGTPPSTARAKFPSRSPPPEAAASPPSAPRRSRFATPRGASRSSLCSTARRRKTSCPPWWAAPAPPAPAG